MSSGSALLISGERRGISAAAIVMAAAVVLLLAAPVAAVHLPPAAVEYPKSLILPLSQLVGDNLIWLARQAEIDGIKIQAITRALVQILNLPIDALSVMLVTGVTAGTGENVHIVAPPLSWLAMSGLVTLLAHALGGARLALVTALGLIFVVAFGFWGDAMATLSSVMLSTVFAVILGIAIGAFAHASPVAAAPTVAIMNVMQTVPVFSYLVPTLLFLGYGPSAALVATVVFALPPMVHATMLGLAGVPKEITEYGRMAGATRRQMFWRIMLPSALPTLGVGLNQTIMASLNMVIIGSMIGAGGLGYVVLLALRRLDIGAALEAGLAIVVLAVILDRLTQAAAGRSARGERVIAVPRRDVRRAALWLIASSIAALLVPALQTWPDALRVTTAPLWNGLVSWINIHLFTVLDAIRTVTLLNLLNPAREYLLALPWTVVVALVAASGYALGGARLAAATGGLAIFVAATGYWDPAMVSIYLVGTGVLISLAIGMPIGFLIARRPSWHEGTRLVLDTLQTLPTLVYILPAVMVFRNGDFAAVLAIVSYAVAPAIRYAMHAFAEVPAQRLEAGAMSGATGWQSLKWISLPAAFPMLILGVNQTVMMAISMLVITALVGTRDLGQQVFIALSRAKVGDGIIGGLAVAAIALIADALLSAWAAREKRRMGLGHATRH